MIYIIGGISMQPDGTAVQIVQGIKPEEGEYTSAVYIIGGITELPGGEAVTIIQGIKIIQENEPQSQAMGDGKKGKLKGKSVEDCECRLTTYLKAEIHKPCPNYDNICLAKRKGPSKFLRPMKECNYIIAGVQKVNGLKGSRYILTGLAKKMYFLDLPKYPEPILPVVGGVVKYKGGNKTFYIQGHTTTLAGKPLVFVLGGIKINQDGSPTYIINCIQQMPSFEPGFYSKLENKCALDIKSSISIIGNKNCNVKDKRNLSYKCKEETSKVKDPCHCRDC